MTEWLEDKIISRYEDIAADFFPKILGVDRERVILLDSSSLLDYGIEQDYGKELDALIDQWICLTKRFYNIDITHIQDLMLVDIFKTIAERSRRDRESLSEL